jgi:hypothetical protein
MNTAVEKDFYTITDDSGERNTAVESLIAEVESEAKPVIQKLDERKEVSFQDRVDLSRFIALLIGRTPEFDATFKSFQDQLVRRISKVMFHSVEQTQKILERYEGGGSESDRDAAKELYEFVQSDEYALQFGRFNTLDVMLNLGHSLAKEFCQMTWIVLHSREDTAFVTTDSPFVILPPADHLTKPTSRGVGIRTPGARKIVSLNGSSALLILERGNATLHLSITRREVRDVNLFMTSRCYRFVIGRDENLLRYLVSRTHIDRTKWNPRMVVE